MGRRRGAAHLHATLCSVLATVRMVSSSVERAHLLAQELKPKSRGVAPSAFAASRRTYVSSIVQEARRLSDHIHEDVLRKLELSRLQYQLMSRSFRLDGRSVHRAGRAVKVAAEKPGGAKKRRALSGPGDQGIGQSRRR